MARGMFRIGAEEIGGSPITIIPGSGGTSLPGKVDYGQIPTDLLLDTEKQREFFQDFYGQFGDKLGGKGEAVGEWLNVLGRYAVGDAELSELEAVDVSGLMDIEGFEDYYYGIVPRKDFPEDTTTETPTDTTSQISDQDAISAVLASVPDKIKGVLTEENLIKVLEQVGQMNDPLKEIKRVLGAGVSVEEGIFKGWEEWKVFGPLAIPGVPLPPGIIDVTLGEIAEAVQNAGEDIQGVIGSVGDFVNKILTEPKKTLEDLGETILGKVNDVVSGVADDPWGGTFGGFEDWVRGILGNVVGGSVLTNIYDSAKDLIEKGTTAVVGGADTEVTETTTGDPTTRFSQLLGTVEDNLAVDPDLFVGSVDTEDTTIDTVGGDDVTQTITNLLGGTIDQLEPPPPKEPPGTPITPVPPYVPPDIPVEPPIVFPPDIGVVPPVPPDGGPDIPPEPPVDPGGNGGGGGGTDGGGGSTVVIGGTTKLDGGGTTTTEIGGGVVPPDSPVVIDPGGTDSSSGGGSVGGGTEGMFTGVMSPLSYVAQPLPGVRVPPPIDSMSNLNALIGRMLTGNIS